MTGMLFPASIALAIVFLKRFVGQEILSLSPQESGPYCIAGYAFGAILAYTAAQWLKQQHPDKNNETTLCILDAPAIEISKQLLASRDERATRDLIAFAACITQLSSASKDPILALSTQDIAMLSSKSIMQQLNHILGRYRGALVVKRCTDQTIMQFNLYSDIIKQNIDALMQYHPEEEKK